MPNAIKPPWDERTTLLRPPPPDPDKAPIENVLEVTELAVIGPDIFTNVRELWHPPGSRGIYGGSMIAQCLASAQKTVPADYLVHSCHCYFLLAGSAATPILFHVERVRDGRSFATRTVQARQRGRCIFTTTMSFVREGSAGTGQVHHAAALPAGAGPPPPSSGVEEEDDDDDEKKAAEQRNPLEGVNVGLADRERKTGRLDERRMLRWSRVRGKISRAGGHQAHLNALAYMSDSYFIGTVSWLHGLWSLPARPEEVAAMLREDGGGDEGRARREWVLQTLRRQGFEAEEDGGGRAAWEKAPRLGMMVSLDHSIYFHEPRRVRADEWMLSEMQSPWSGDGRGVVQQKIFARDGTLLATCVQEGVVRLDKEGRERTSRM